MGETWFENLQPGDKVILASLYDGTRVQTVIRRAPTGRIILNDNSGWSSPWRRIGGDSYLQRSLAEATPEALHTAEAHAALRLLTGVKWNKLPKDVLIRVAAIVKEATSAPAAVAKAEGEVQGG